MMMSSEDRGPNGREFEPERKTFRSSRGRFSYLEWDHAGPDAPRLHFAHANGFNAQTYTKLLARLARSYHIFAWDARGHGLTEAQTTPGMLHGSWVEYEKDLTELIRHLGSPLVLVGHSLGAVVSMQVAARHPELVTSLLLLDPVILPKRVLRIWRVAKHLGLSRRFHLATRARKRRRIWPDTQAIITAYRGRGGFRTWSCTGCLEDYVAGGTRPTPSGEVELTCPPDWESETFMSLPHDTWETMARVSCPFTILYGEDSDTFLDAAARRVTRHHPHINLLPVPQATHFVPMEKQELVAQAINNVMLSNPGSQARDSGEHNNSQHTDLTNN